MTRILRLPNVIERTGLSRSAIYLRMNTGQFPAACSLGGRAIGWLESDIEDWIMQRISESSKCGHAQLRGQNV